MDASLWKNDHENIVCSWFVSEIGLPETTFSPAYLVIGVYDPDREYGVGFFDRLDNIASITTSYAAKKNMTDLPIIFQRSGLPLNRGVPMPIYRENGCVYHGTGDSDCYENDTRMNVTTLSEEESRMAQMAFSDGSLFVTNETTSESIRMYLIEKGLTEERKAAIDPYEETRFFRKALLSFFRWAGIVKN